MSNTYAKEEEDGEVLALYDVRGIQDYIFRTNEAKDIIGASNLIENILINGMNNVIEENGWNPDYYLTDWENDSPKLFFDDQRVKMQVLFIGGGNAYVLFRKYSDCSIMNRKLGKWILGNTYSLNLAIAVVKKTDDYFEDYQNVQTEMERIKATMPETKPIGAMPFMKSDSVTGYPLVLDKGQEISTESKNKREYLNKNEDAEKIFDHMVTKKGDNSFLAVVHIDGNSMGRRIQELMQEETDYLKAVEKMRSISLNINHSYSEAYGKMEEYIENELADKIKKNRHGKLSRKMISAGDDITFVCNAKVAIQAVIEFLKYISDKVIYSENKRGNDLGNYALSACAGIAYFNSHFPFSDAYQVAESCCSSAKNRAKKMKEEIEGTKEAIDKEKKYRIGNFIDYQICEHIRAAELSEYRKRTYTTADGTSIIMRPYYVPIESWKGFSNLDENNKKYNVNILIDNLNYFQNDKEIPRSQAKRLRDCCSLGKDEVEKYVTFLESRGRKLPKEDYGEYYWSYWFDALEIMDITM